MWFGFKKQEEVQSTSTRHKAAHSKGGFNLSFGDNGSDVQKATASILKQMGTSLMSGNFKSLLQISKPIAISADSTFLHGLARGHSYSRILNQCSNESPLEQIKQICIFYIAGLHVDSEIIKLKAPLDPLVGETIQLVSSNSDEFYAEQVSFDPPICYYQIYGQNYKIHGVDQLEVNFHKTLNSLTGIQQGTSTIQFNNGAVYKFTEQPKMEICGLIMGERIINWSGRTCIEGPGVKATITFNYNNEGLVSKLTSFMRTQDPQQISDLLTIEITQGENQYLGKGSWLESVSFDDIVYWTVDMEKCTWQEQTNILESDSNNRRDLKFMRSNDLDQAQKAKLELEEQCRKDLGMRK